MEQAGIAYPIIDPLRSLVGERATFTSQSTLRNTLTRESQRGARVHSEHSPESDSELVRPANPEPHQQPTRIPSIASNPTQFVRYRGGGHPGVWHNSYGPFIDDDFSMGSWPSQRNASNLSGLPSFYDAPFPPYAASPWPPSAAISAYRTGPNVNGNRRRKDNNAQQVTMTLRSDQFGQILEAISPSKRQRDTSGLSAQQQQMHQPGAQTHRPPKMGALSVPVRPSSAAIALVQR